MFPKRYEIQVSHDLQRTWHTWYGEPTFRTLRNADKAWWALVQREWHYAADKPIFRVYDLVEKKQVR